MGSCARTFRDCRWKNCGPHERESNYVIQIEWNCQRGCCCRGLRLRFGEGEGNRAGYSAMEEKHANRRGTRPKSVAPTLRRVEVAWRAPRANESACLAGAARVLHCSRYQ